MDSGGARISSSPDSKTPVPDFVLFPLTRRLRPHVLTWSRKLPLTEIQWDSGVADDMGSAWIQTRALWGYLWLVFRIEMNAEMLGVIWAFLQSFPSSV